MKNEFIPYEEALALKELGFDEKCFSHYYRDGDISRKFHLAPITNDCILVECAAPLYQQAFRWFREEHGIWVTFEYDDCDCVESDICWYVGNCFRYGIGPLFLTNELGDFKTYEQAQLACLKKLIEIVKQNKDE